MITVVATSYYDRWQHLFCSTTFPICPFPPSNKEEVYAPTKLEDQLYTNYRLRLNQYNEKLDSD